MRKVNTTKRFYLWLLKCGVAKHRAGEQNDVWSLAAEYIHTNPLLVAALLKLTPNKQYGLIMAWGYIWETSVAEFVITDESFQKAVLANSMVHLTVENVGSLIVPYLEKCVVDAKLFGPDVVIEKQVRHLTFAMTRAWRSILLTDFKDETLCERLKVLFPCKGITAIVKKIKQQNADRDALIFGPAGREMAVLHV